MTTPIVILCGKAGSGKDTVAQILAEEYGAGALAMADPMKRFASRLLGFPSGVLWGESSLRSTMDTRFARHSEWGGVEDALRHASYIPKWVTSIGASLIHYDALRTRWLPLLETFALQNGGLTPRYALQTLGTEWGRTSVGEDVWVEHAIDNARQVVRGVSYARETGLAVGTPRRKPLPFVMITDGRFANEILAVKEAGGLAVLIETEGSGSVDTHASERGLDDVPMQWFDAIIANDKAAGIPALRRAVTGLFADLFDARVAILDRRADDAS